MDHLKISLDNVRTFNQESMKERRAPHILFHFVSEAPFNVPRVTYASPLVEHKLTGKFNGLSAAFVKNLLKTSNIDLQSWRGKQMEYAMISSLITKDLSLRVLSESAIRMKKQKLFDTTATSRDPDTAYSTFSHLHYPSKIIHSHTEIQLKNGSFLYMPVSKTFPSIDSLLVDAPSQSILYIQCTIGLKHPKEGRVIY